MKRFIPGLGRFWLFGNLHIACCATLMAWQTMVVFRLPTSFWVLALVFMATLCSYSLHWFLTGENENDTLRWRWTARYRYGLLVLFIASALGTIFCVYQLSSYTLYIIGTAAIAFLYTAPKLPFVPFTWLRPYVYEKTLYLSLVWTWVTTVFVLLLSDTPLQGIHGLYAGSQFLIIYPVCILFDLRTKTVERTELFRNSIYWLGHKRVRLLYFSALPLQAVVLTALGYSGALPVRYLVFVGLSASLLPYSYYRSQRVNTDYWYYLWLDTLMALSAWGMVGYVVF